jgi:hypothetical protein
MSEYHVEKRREAAELMLTTGTTVAGFLFLSSSSAAHTGPERVADLLNREAGFFPFEAATGETSLVNRVHVLKVTLAAPVIEAQLDAGYDVADRLSVRLLLTSGEHLRGTVTVYGPPGRRRLSDYYGHLGAAFRYLEQPDRTLLINSAHIVALSEVDA